MRDIKGRKKWVTSGFLFLVAALITALALTSCAGGGGNGEEPEQRIVKYGFPTTGLGGYIGIDPNSAQYIVGQACSDTLIKRDPATRALVPGLATSWEANRDELYVDYVLRQDVKFQNGDPFTAEDVQYSIERMKDPDIAGPSDAALYDDFIGEVEIIDDYHVRVHYKQWAWGSLTVSPWIVPMNYIEEEGLEEWAEEPVLTGPFKIVDWERDISVHFVKAFPEEGHWYYGSDTPNYDELYIYSIVEPSTRLAMLKAGELDAAQVPPANIPDVENDPNLTMVMSEYGSAYWIIFYDMDLPGPSPLQDPNVRKAVSLAIDRAGIAENVFFDTYEPWGSYYAPYMLGYRYRDPDPYDPDEARRLLEEAGYPDGFDTVFSYPLDYTQQSQAVIASLANAGIRAEAQGLEPTTWGTMLYNEELTGMGYLHVPWWGGNYYPDVVFGQEVMDWASAFAKRIPEIGAAFGNMLFLTETMEELEQAAWEAEDVFFELGYKIPVWAIHAAYAYGSTIDSWQPEMGEPQHPNLVYIKYK